jgi:hypothetical protein
MDFSRLSEVDCGQFTKRFGADGMGFASSLIVAVTLEVDVEL